MPKLTTLCDGSLLMTWSNDRGTLDATQYVVHRGRVHAVHDRGVLVPAFDGLRLHHKEPLELAVRRGLAGERGTQVIDAPHVARMLLVGAVVVAAYVMVRL